MLSPNFTKSRNRKIKAIIIHYTGVENTQSAINWMRDPASRVSAHYVISRKGKVTQLVDLKNVAWHAGKSEMEINGEKTKNVNNQTIGIELANCGLLTIKKDRFYYKIGKILVPYNKELKPVKATIKFNNGKMVNGYWEPYSEKQMKSLMLLLSYLKNIGYSEATNNLLSHSDIAIPIGRKLDPGPLFDWGAIKNI